MNGDGGGTSREVKMEDRESTQRVVYMWGYLPGALQQRSPLLSPTIVRLPSPSSWMDVCGGGCGFAVAISGVSFDLRFFKIWFFSPTLWLLLRLIGFDVDWDPVLRPIGFCYYLIPLFGQRENAGVIKVSKSKKSR